MAASKQTSKKSSSTKASRKVTIPNQAMLAEALAATSQEEVTSMVKQSVMPKQTKRMWPVLLAALAVIVIVGVVFKDQFVVAMVNGKPITRAAYTREMERQVGKQTLENLVMESLIANEAMKQGVAVDLAELDTEIKALEDRMQQQGQTLDAVLEQEGMTRADLTRQIRLQKLIEKMSPKDEEITDEKIQAFLAENQEMMPEDATDEELATMAKEQLASQSGREAVQQWLEKLKAEAKIEYWN